MGGRIVSGFHVDENELQVPQTKNSCKVCGIPPIGQETLDGWGTHGLSLGKKAGPFFRDDLRRNGPAVDAMGLLKQGALFVVRNGFFRRDDDGGGDLVVGFQVEEADALGGAAGGANGLGVDADDFAELTDDH